MVGIRSLSIALENAGSTPCVSFSCQNREECSREKLACSAFRYFVQTGRAVDPFMDVPVRITKTQQPELKESIVATREIFDSMEVDDDFYRPEKGDRQTDDVWEIVNSAIEAKTALQTVWE